MERPWRWGFLARKDGVSRLKAGQGSRIEALLLNHFSSKVSSSRWLFQIMDYLWNSLASMEGISPSVEQS